MSDLDRRTRGDEVSARPLDLLSVRRDDALLDRLGAELRETPGAADPVERLLVAWVQQTRRLETPAHTRTRPATDARPRRVVAVRQALVGAAVLAGALAGGAGVAAAGDPLAGFVRLQQTVIAAASPEDQPPLLRSEDGVTAQHQLDRARELLAAGDVEGAWDVLDDVSALVRSLPADEQAMMRDDLSKAHELLAASLGDRPGSSGRVTVPGAGTPSIGDVDPGAGTSDQASDAPGDRLADGRAGRPQQAPSSPAAGRPVTAPARPSAAPTTAPPSLPTSEPSRTDGPSSPAVTTSPSVSETAEPTTTAEVHQPVDPAAGAHPSAPPADPPRGPPVDPPGSPPSTPAAPIPS